MICRRTFASPASANVHRRSALICRRTFASPASANVHRRSALICRRTFASPASANVHRWIRCTFAPVRSRPPQPSLGRQPAARSTIGPSRSRICSSVRPGTAKLARPRPVRTCTSGSRRGPRSHPRRAGGSSMATISRARRRPRAVPVDRVSKSTPAAEKRSSRSSSPRRIAAIPSRCTAATHTPSGAVGAAGAGWAGVAGAAWAVAVAVAAGSGSLALPGPWPGSSALSGPWPGSSGPGSRRRGRRPAHARGARPGATPPRRARSPARRSPPRPGSGATTRRRPEPPRR